ncbi:acyl-CoA thioesterase [Mucilaginibacter limnophilus]|uniref:Acyl-CoA thioesterase n=1 Tax=Mucilaginibacter limnophilus TaxID=1932778 RepID=A0A3S2Y0D2_9SPHI|nr:acyl-CoA thioesterase [Mucilaginibacter limnophilus]RVU00511.1 acyl-CoA thioesterase [Mucilaginibacter limnophilus]
MYKTFETELRVRPDDIDMYQHVHNSKYFDYVQAARYEQMDVNYGMSMEVFLSRGFGWLVRAVHIVYKRPLLMGDYFIVRTSVEDISKKSCRVKFSIIIKSSGKVSADGWFDFVLIDMKTGKGVTIPEDIIKHYTQFTEGA